MLLYRWCGFPCLTILFGSLSLFFSRNFRSSSFFLRLSGSILGIPSIIGYHLRHFWHCSTPSAISIVWYSVQLGFSSAGSFCCGMRSRVRIVSLFPQLFLLVSLVGGRVVLGGSSCIWGVPVGLLACISLVSSALMVLLGFKVYGGCFYGGL